MGGGFAGEEKVESGIPRLLAEGLVGIEVVPQEGAVPVGILGAPGVDPAGSCPDLAVLLFPTVLLDNSGGSGTTRGSPRATSAGVTAM